MRNLIRRGLVSLFLPFILLVVVPIIVVDQGGSNQIAPMAKAPVSVVASALGWLLIAIGLGLGLATMPLFLRQRSGTVMPWEPAGELIVEGVYLHVRNPMHTGVFSILFGEGLVLRSPGILTVGIGVVLVHLFYIPLSEERGLERRFGEAYRRYKENVPRWIPRWTPWKPDEA